METIQSYSEKSSSDCLQQLLDMNQTFLLAANGTTNHCPMALVALSRMGASEVRLRNFFQHWKQNFFHEANHLSLQRIEGTWHDYLGDVNAFHALQAYFRQEIERNGASAVMVNFCETIQFAPASGAFHAVIRLAYGLDVAHAGEIAAGLAYMVCTHLPISLQEMDQETERGQLQERMQVTTVAEGLTHLARRHMQPYPGRLITARLRAVVGDPDFSGDCPHLTYDEHVLRDLADMAIRLYWQTRDFTVLHMVTGVSAARQIMAHLPVPLQRRLLTDLWHAYCAAYVAAGAPQLSHASLNVQADPAGLNWQSGMDKAIQSENEHHIKMTYTCFLEYQVSRAPIYLAVVQRLFAESQ